jgi:senataxin
MFNIRQHYDARVAIQTNGLNSSQQDAVQRFVNASDGVVLLQGPPGTGKTTTIVQMLAALVAKRLRVLVCAPSNKAVQVLAERFIEKFNITPVILAGIESKISDVLRPIFLHKWNSDCFAFLSDTNIVATAKKNKSLFVQALKKASSDVDEAKKRIAIHFPEISDVLFLQLKQHLLALQREAQLFDFSKEDASYFFPFHIDEKLKELKRLKNQILVKLPSDDAIEANRSKIIFSTLSVAGRAQMLKDDINEVDVLIVDEAGQSVEAETLIAFQHMPKKVLLVGDTKQLPASVLSQLAKEKKFDRSMMERLELISGTTSRPLQLTIQYRMHTDINEWPSKQFYGGKLTTDTSVNSHANTGLQQSIAFYDITSGKEGKSGTSRKNEKEANYVIEIIRRLRETDKKSRIGVITFYTAQVDAIQNKLKQEASDVKKLVTVNTVDGFQGDEREIIILSCVCAGNTIGFLNDPRRLNVAITRAKNTRIVIGNSGTLEGTISDLKSLVVDLRRRKRFFTEEQLDGFLGKQIQSQKKKNGKTPFVTEVNGT